MSTIASPRASISVRSASSTRASFDSSIRPANPRRNRTALREFYGLKNAPKDTEPKISEESSRYELGPEEDETLTELDAADFNPEAFVENLLATQGLKGVLKVEADLISQIRNLDSDRKSLVYDNYSKLLSATTTIRSMRGNMDPLAPTTKTLGPAISHIAEMASSLSSTRTAPPQSEGLGLDIRVEQPDIVEDEEAVKRRKQKETVRWVLDTPRRLQLMIDREQDEEADKEWGEVSRILEKWIHVKGAKALREKCEALMEEEAKEAEEDEEDASE